MPKSWFKDLKRNYLERSAFSISVLPPLYRGWRFGWGPSEGSRVLKCPLRLAWFSLWICKLYFYIFCNLLKGWLKKTSLLVICCEIPLYDKIYPFNYLYDKIYTISYYSGFYSSLYDKIWANVVILNFGQDLRMDFIHSFWILSFLFICWQNFEISTICSNLTFREL